MTKRSNGFDGPDFISDIERTFIHEYLRNGFDQIEAARAAYATHIDGKKRLNNKNSKPLLDNSLSNRAHMWMKKPQIKKEIARLMEARCKRLDIDADWLLTRLADEAEADILDLYEENGTLKPIKAWPLIWRKGLIKEVEMAVVPGRGSGRRSVPVLRVKVSDRVRRLEMIGRHVNVKAFADAPITVPNITVTINRPEYNEKDHADD